MLCHDYVLLKIRPKNQHGVDNLPTVAADRIFRRIQESGCLANLASNQRKVYPDAPNAKHGIICTASCSRCDVLFTNQQKKHPLKMAQAIIAQTGRGPFIISLFQFII